MYYFVSFYTFLVALCHDKKKKKKKGLADQNMKQKST